MVGFGATSDGEDMVAPSGDGAMACMRQAMEGLDGPIDYINTHGTSTPVGDMQEVRAMQAVFGDAVPPFFQHQIAHRPLAGRHGRAGSHLLPDHAQQGFYCRFGQRGNARPAAGQ